MTFDPTVEASVRFNGCLPAALPSKLDDEVDEFVTEIMAAGIASVLDLLPRRTESGRDILTIYGERMASLAVRRKDAEIINKALVAVVLGGLDENRRESLLVMAPIDDAIRRLGLDPTEVFEEVSEIVGHPGTVSLVTWLSRKEEDRTLESMRFVATEDPDGFRYRLDW